MIRVHRALGRAIVVQVSASVQTLDVLRFQQELSSQLRRLGDPAILLTDLRDLHGVDPDAGRMLRAMLASPALVLRHAILVKPETAGADIAAGVVLARGGSWTICSSEAQVSDALRGVATPAELHTARALFHERKAA